jgi:hypothetical protein
MRLNARHSAPERAPESQEKPGKANASHGGVKNTAAWREVEAVYAE